MPILYELTQLRTATIFFTNHYIRKHNIVPDFVKDSLYSKSNIKENEWHLLMEFNEAEKKIILELRPWRGEVVSLRSFLVCCLYNQIPVFNRDSASCYYRRCFGPATNLKGYYLQ